MQELIDRQHTPTNNGWTITVTREDNGNTVRGYIVTAHNDTRITTLFTVPVGNTWTQSTAFAIALNYARHAVDGIEQFGHLPNYAPRHTNFYRD